MTGYRLALGVCLVVGLCSAPARSALAAEMKFATQAFPPFSYEANGKAAGPLVEVVTLVCERLKAKCSIEVLPWRRAVDMAEGGELDGIFPVSRTPEREKELHISDFITETAYSFFAPEASSFKYGQPKDLDGRTIGVYGPSGTATALEDALKAGSTGRAIIELTNVVVLKKVAEGRYGDKGLGLVNRDVALQLLKSEGIAGVKAVGELKKLAYGIGFSRKKVDPATFTQFNDALKAVIKEGKVKAILDKHSIRPAP